MQDISKSIEACAAYYGDDAAAVRDYLIEGQKRALALPTAGLCGLWIMVISTAIF